VTPARVLWSGGFDSTFLVLELLREGRLVCPVVMADDPTWNKRRQEGAARRYVADLLPADWRAKLAPEEVVPFAAFQSRMTIREQEAHGEAWDFSPQTPALAAVADLAGPLLAGYVAEDDAVRGGSVTLLHRAGVATPLQGWTKLDLVAQAERRGWLPILDRTWSCEEASGRTPCGWCVPCLLRVRPVKAAA
jgi:hypothetical protein